MRIALITLSSLGIAAVLFGILAEPQTLLRTVRDGGAWVASRVRVAVESARHTDKVQELPALPKLEAAPVPPPTAAAEAPAHVSTLTTVEGPAGFGAFWRTFRPALLERDVVTVASMTQLPLVVRSTVEDAPVRQVARKQLEDTLGRVLERDVPRLVEARTGLGIRHQTQQAFLQEHAALTELDVFGERWARVGDLQFRFKQGKWRWYQAILDD